MIAAWLFPLSVSAQIILEKGYYLHRPDSARVEGYFDFSLNDFNSVSFYEKENGLKTRELHPAEVRAIVGEKGGLFLPVTIRRQGVENEIFVLRILDAETSLFEGRVESLKDVYFVRSTARPQLTMVNGHNPDVFLKTYLGEHCVPKSRVRYTKNNLLHVLRQHAICMGNGVQEQPKNRFKLNMALGVRAGVSYSKPTVSGFYVSEFAPTYNPVLGADLQIQLTRMLHARLGFLFARNTLFKPNGNAVQYTFRGWPFTLSGPLQIAYDNYEVPLEVLWIWNKNKKFSPFLGAGVSYLRTTNPKYEQNFTKTDYFRPNFYSFTEQDVINSLPGEMGTIYRYSIIPLVKTGVIMRFKNRSFLEFDIRYKTQEEDFLLLKSRRLVEVSSKRWFDFSLAFYVPLTKQR